MESLNERFGESEEAEILACGIVIAVSDGHGMTFTRTYSTEDIYYRALGLFHAGLEAIEGDRSAPDEDEIDEEN